MKFYAQIAVALPQFTNNLGLLVEAPDLQSALDQLHAFRQGVQALWFNQKTGPLGPDTLLIHTLGTSKARGVMYQELSEWGVRL